MTEQEGTKVLDPPKELSLITEEIEHLPRHEDLWFEDGNIVVAVSDLSFRLHRGVLARHSSIFKDMFQLPQAAEVPMAHRCPAVQLHHDRGADLIVLLTLLYDGIKE